MRADRIRSDSGTARASPDGQIRLRPSRRGLLSGATKSRPLPCAAPFELEIESPPATCRGRFRLREDFALGDSTDAAVDIHGQDCTVSSGAEIAVRDLVRGVR